MDPLVLDVGLAELLGFRFDSLGPDRVTMSWATKPGHIQPFGLVHGGVYCAAATTAASIGGQLWYGDRGQVVGVSNHTDIFRPVSDGVLVAVGTPIHRGRTQQLWASTSATSGTGWSRGDRSGCRTFRPRQRPVARLRRPRVRSWNSAFSPSRRWAPRTPIS